MEKNNIKSVVSTLAVVMGLAAGNVWAAEAPLDVKMVERGRYLSVTSGCNDCHTPGYFESDGNVPQERWLSGDTLGWRGAWGTTYASNLRLFVKDMSEDEWVSVAKTLKRRPPMPWFNLNKMEENDLRALYQFTKSLGEPGMPAPAYVPPGQEPSTPYALFPSPPESKVPQHPKAPSAIKVN
jgi:mono/diheme cytochrome c family protein